MSTIVEEVITRLHKMNADELDEVSNQIDAIRDIGVPDSPSHDADIDLVLSSLVKVLRQAGVEYCTPTILKKSTGFATFKKKVPPLMEYVKKAGKSRVAQHAILDMGVDLLYDHLFSRGYPVGSRILMNSIHRLPAVINMQFPGYAESGLLSWVARQEEKRNAKGTS